MGTPPQKRTQPATQAGPSPEALAAYYRLRSESLHNSHTTTEEATPQQNQGKAAPPDDHGGMGIVAYLISALAGHPGKP